MCYGLEDSYGLFVMLRSALFISIGGSAPRRRLFFLPRGRVALSTTREVRRLRSHRTRERLTPLESSEDLYIQRERESERARGEPERVPSSSEADFNAGVDL